MGIYHFRVNVVKKATQSAVAKAAYVSGEKIYSERDEENKKYRSREVQPVSYILAPKHAPEWVYDRVKLWNEVEKIEKPVNAQLLREAVIALPIELNKDQQFELITTFVKENFVDEGMVADVNIHYDKDENPHAHVLLTMRPFNLDGTWGAKSKKEYLRDEEGNFLLDEQGKKRSRKIDTTNWNKKETLLKWRENWANLVNEKYKELNINASVSHKSNQDLGLEKVARFRLSREEYYVEQKAKQEAELSNKPYVAVTTYGKINQEIAQHNAEIELINNRIQELNVEKLHAQGKTKSIALFVTMRKNMFEEMQKQSEPVRTSVQFLQKRFNAQFLTSDNINTFDKNLNNFKDKIAVEARNNQYLKEYLEQIKATFENEPQNLFKFGLTKETFAQHYNEQLQQFNYQEERLLNRYENYKNLEQMRKDFKASYYEEIYKQFVTLYPDYESIVQFKTDENLKVMQRYLDHFTEHKELLPVKEFMDVDLLSDVEEHSLRTSISHNLETYKKYVKLNFSFEKKLEALKQEYGNLLIENSPDKREEISTLSLEYLKVKREYEYIKKRFAESKNGMYENLKFIYGESNKKLVDSLNDKEKVAILSAYIKENRYIEPAEINAMRAYDQYQKQAQMSNENTGDLLAQMLAIMASESMKVEKSRNKYNRKTKKRENSNER